MEDTFSNAILLLAVGMLTVFFILSMVMFSGRILIQISNKMMPAIVAENTTANSDASALVQSQTSDAKNMAILGAIIADVTQGQGVITKIEKQD